MGKQGSIEAKSYVGVGLYSFAEAARIIKVPRSTLSSWLRGYSYEIEGRRYRVEPVVRRYFRDEPVITFLELIELLFVKLFRDQGLSMKAIRLAARRASEIFDHDYPFAVRRFDTDGRYIFATLHDEVEDKRLVAELTRGQFAFEAVVRPFFRKLEYDNMTVSMYWPLTKSGRVVLDPKRNFGQPIDAETGVPTRVLYEATQADGGHTVEEVAEWFNVPVEAVRDAIRYELSLNAA